MLNMVAIEVDQPQNLLVLRYRGAVGAAEMQCGLDQIQTGLAKLESGFRLLGDLTELESMDVSCAPFLEKIMDMCNEKGVATVVRVVPDPHRDIGLQIMSYFHYSGDVRIVTCETLVEAMEILRAQG
jgi:anti-anti-sigma regulatory factor